MKKQHFLSLLGLVIFGLGFPFLLEAQSRNPLLKTLPNYRLEYKESGYASMGIPMSPDRIDFLDGEKTFMQFSYRYNSSPGSYRIFDKYHQLTRRYGGTLIYSQDNYASFKLVRDNKEYWLVLETYEDGKDFSLALLEREVIHFDMSEDEFIAALNTKGSISLYVNFSSGDSELPEGAEVALSRITAFLMMHSELKISIEGHTDNVGSRIDNRLLSEARARAVMRELVEEGIDESRLTARGWGAEKPIGDNGTEEGRKQNRRVELVKVQ